MHAIHTKMLAFTVSIDQAENRALWCRCLHSVAQISEEIRFTVHSNRLTVSSKNTAYTSFMDVEFDRAFFRTFELNTDAIAEGLAEVEGSLVFSFSVRSKLLSMLFKRHEEDVETFALSIDLSDSCPQSLKYRLQVEVFTKRLVRKRFTPFYTPCAPEVQRLSTVYKDTFIKQKSKMDELLDIRFLMMAVATLRNFLDNTGPTEHFKMDVNANVFSVTAFTRGVSTKEREILKQPMAVNMSFKTDELQDLQINDEQNVLVFRLKEFKSFLALGSNAEAVECWFRTGGDPILFEMNKHSATIRLILDTDNDVNISHEALKTKRTPGQPKRAVGVNVEVPVEESGNNSPETVQVGDAPLFVEEDDTDHGEDDKEVGGVYAVDEFGNDHDDDEPRVTWGDPAEDSHALNSLLHTRNQVINDARAQYIESLKRRKLQRQRETSVESQQGLGPTQNQEQLGPTQGVCKPSGLFD